MTVRSVSTVRAPLRTCSVRIAAAAAPMSARARSVSVRCAALRAAPLRPTAANVTSNALAPITHPETAAALGRVLAARCVEFCCGFAVRSKGDTGCEAGTALSRDRSRCFCVGRRSPALKGVDRNVLRSTLWRRSMPRSRRRGRSTVRAEVPQIPPPVSLERCARSSARRCWPQAQVVLRG